MYYLYNGVRLPELPEYDKAVYPYAVLDKTNAGTSFLFYAFKSRPYYGTNPADSTKRGVYSTGGAKVYYFVPADGGSEWEHSMDTDNPFAAEDGNENTLFWTNTDILYEGDGSVWLAASVPVAISDWRKSFLTGLSLGLTGMPLPFAQREPVAYLYNGVRLPKLPEWDKTAYPYAVIGQCLSDGREFDYELTLYPNPATISDTTWWDGVSNMLVQKPYAPVYCYYFSIGDADWRNGTLTDYDVGIVTPVSINGGNFPLIWSNTALKMESDNSVYLAGSDPVPVYE